MRSLLAFVLAFCILIGSDARAKGRAPTAFTLSEQSFSDYLCNLKKRLQYRHRPWNKKMCSKIARATLTSARKYGVNPLLVSSVYLNESELVGSAVLTSRRKNGQPFAADIGLMGIRCRLGRGNICTNSGVRGLKLADLADPVRNIDIGTRRLAYWMKGAGEEKISVWRKGKRHRELIPCRHTNHAWWAHYNHGSRYYATGRARHYPHRIAVLYWALVDSLRQPVPPELEGPITVRDRRRPPRTLSQPVGRRYKRLVRMIRASAAEVVPPLAASR